MTNKKTNLKETAIELLTTNKGKMNEETKCYQMTQENFEYMLENLPDTLQIKKAKGSDNVYGVLSKTGKTAYAKIEIIKKAEKVKKEKTKKENDNAAGKAGHKAKGNHYIILLKKKDEKQEQKITNIDNCTDIKKFLKTVSKRQLEYLKIYDANNNEVRKSAWVV